MTKVLIVEDDVAFALMLRTWLSKNGYEAESVVSAEQAVKRMGECVFDVVLSDLRLPDRDGITLLEWIRHKSPHSEVIIMTGYANVSTAVAAIKLGAFDYLEKPVNPEILREKMTAAVTRHEQRRSRPETQSASEPGTAIVWGHSEASAKLRDHLLLVAPTNMSVLITGESGTGKEYAARFIHANSKRKARPFVAVDCGVLSRELAASELFGHAKGAFTSAVSDKKGVFETAEGGTVFLDEIGNLPYDVQVQLLRAIQERVIRPVGSVRETAVDVRIIAATNENLLEAIRENKFRGDLFHRLDEFTVQRHGAGMISVETYVDRQMVATYHGDGVIVSTPTGSTAYSLSAGGPVVAPTCQCLVISPLAPHNLTMRPVVIPDTGVITLNVDARRADAFVTLDNRTYPVSHGASFTVERAEQTIFLAVPHNISFYDTLRNKMMWGIDIRS